MLYQYHSQLGEKRKYEADARYNAFINKWAVRTKEILKGRGIKLYEEKDNTGRHFYYCTQKAFDKLCKEMNINQDLLFD